MSDEELSDEAIEAYERMGKELEETMKMFEEDNEMKRRILGTPMKY